MGNISESLKSSLSEPESIGTASNEERELLCFGYVREIEQEIILSNIIPKDIKNIIYSFCNCCDSWDLEYNNSNKVNIVGSTLIAINDSSSTNYGNQIIKNNEYYTWKLRLKSRKKNSYAHQPNIGVIENDKNILFQYKNNSTNWYGAKGYYLSSTSKLIFGNSGIKKYEATFQNKGDIMEMTLDLRNNTLSYCINNNDFGIAIKNISCDDNKGYRLAVSMHCGIGTAVELL